MKRVAVSTLVILLLFLTPRDVFASKGEVAGTLIYCKAQVSIQRHGESAFMTASTNMQLFSGDTLRTEAKSYAAVLYKTGTIMKVNENTTIHFPEEKKSSIFEMIFGEIWIKIKPGKQKIHTRGANIYIEGTELDIKFTGKAQTVLTLIEGKVTMENEKGSVHLVEPSTQSTAMVEHAPEKPIAVDVKSVMEWTRNIIIRVTYPRSFYYPDDETRKRSRQACRDRLGREPENAEALTDLGNILTDEGIFDKAEAHYKKALKAHPEYIPAWNGLSYLYWLKGDCAEAKKCALHVSGPGRDSVKALYLCGLASDSVGDHNDAVTCYTRALVRDPRNREVLRNLGIDMWIAGFYKDAEALFNRLITLYPDDAEGFLQLGVTEMIQGNHDLAEKVLKTAVKMNPGDWRGWFNLGNVMEILGKPDEALSCYEKVLAIDAHNLDAINSIGACYYRAKNYSLASGWFKKAEKVAPQDYQASNNLALCYIGVNDWKGAESILISSLKKYPRKSPLIYNMAVLSQKKKDYDAAISYYREALNYNPCYQEARMNLTKLLAQKGRRGEAIDILRAGVRLSPQEWELSCNLGNLLYEAHQPEEAEKYLKSSLEVKPEQDRAYQILGLISIEKGDTDAAEKYLREAEKNNPESSELYNHFGTLYIKENRLEEAEKILVKALALKENNAQACNNLGLVYLKKGDTGQAFSYLKKALGLEPQMPEAHSNMGLYCMMTGDSRKAEEHYKKAITLNNTLEDAYIGLGALYYTSGKTKESESIYRALVAVNARNFEGLSSLGYVRYQQGDSEQALKYCRKAVEYGPLSTTTHYNLAWVLRGKEHTDEAINEWKEVSRLSPDSWEGLIARAYTAFYSGDLTGAEKLCEDSIKMNPRNADAYFLKGLIELKQNKKADARKEFEKALEMDLSHCDARKMLKEI